MPSENRPTRFLFLLLSAVARASRPWTYNVPTRFVVLLLVCPLCAHAVDDVVIPPNENRTLDPIYAGAFPLPDQRVQNDTGVNVLVDLAHQASFFTMWHVPSGLNRKGFRAVGSQAALDSVLDPKGLSRVRLRIEDRRPFAWWPNADYNVVITVQTNPDSQVYLPEERAALRRFVENGGGLIVVGDRLPDDARRAAWPLNQLLQEYEAAFSGNDIEFEGVRASAIDTKPSWTPLLQGPNGEVAVTGRTVGKGRVLAAGGIGLIDWNARDLTDEAQDARLARLAEWVRWASAGKPPVGGTTRLPAAAGGGGGIYPEQEQRLGGVVVYYAKNQKQTLLDTVTNEMPGVKAQIEEWLPSGRPAEDARPASARPEMYIILSAGGGGGWAVNAYEPKEAGIISLDAEGVLSIFAHELAHTMGGPRNDAGAYAGNTPDGNQGEAHAGWFQGKIKAMRTGDRGSHDPNRLFDFDPTGTELDLAMHPDQLRERWGKGKDWTKIWWIWQKLDDHYGPTWYPRWRWVQHTRHAATPEKKLSWEEVAEDMSIAVGEDLFPFMRAAGTSLSRRRFPVAEFNGEKLQLRVAPIEVGPAGPARFDPILDYRQPIALDAPAK